MDENDQRLPFNGLNGFNSTSSLQQIVQIANGQGHQATGPDFNNISASIASSKSGGSVASLAAAAAIASSKYSIWDTIIVILLVSLIVISIVGNLLVCVAVCTERRLRKLGNAFIVSLAIADLFVSCLVMTFALCNDLLEYWPFGDHFCDIFISLDIMCCTASILNLCAISLDRFIMIKDCLLYNRVMTRKVALVSLLLIWFISGLVSFVPITLGWHKPDHTFSGSNGSGSGALRETGQSFGSSRLVSINGNIVAKSGVRRSDASSRLQRRLAADIEPETRAFPLIESPYDAYELSASDLRSASRLLAAPGAISSQQTQSSPLYSIGNDGSGSEQLEPRARHDYNDKLDHHERHGHEHEAAPANTNFKIGTAAAAAGNKLLEPEQVGLIGADGLNSQMATSFSDQQDKDLEQKLLFGAKVNNENKIDKQSHRHHFYNTKKHPSASLAEVAQTRAASQRSDVKTKIGYFAATAGGSGNNRQAFESTTATLRIDSIHLSAMDKSTPAGRRLDHKSDFKSANGLSGSGSSDTGSQSYTTTNVFYTDNDNDVGASRRRRRKSKIDDDAAASSNHDRNHGDSDDDRNLKATSGGGNLAATPEDQSIQPALLRPGVSDRLHVQLPVTNSQRKTTTLKNHRTNTKRSIGSPEATSMMNADGVKMMVVTKTEAAPLSSKSEPVHDRHDREYDQLIDQLEPDGSDQSGGASAADYHRQRQQPYSSGADSLINSDINSKDNAFDSIGNPMSNSNYDYDSSANSNYVDPSQRPQCILTLTPTYAIVSSTISFYIPCMIMIYLYTKLWACARKHFKNIQSISKAPAPILGIITTPSMDSSSAVSQAQSKQNHNQAQQQPKSALKQTTFGNDGSSAQKTGANLAEPEPEARIRMAYVDEDERDLDPAESDPFLQSRNRKNNHAAAAAAARSRHRLEASGAEPETDHTKLVNKTNNESSPPLGYNDHDHVDDCDDESRVATNDVDEDKDHHRKRDNLDREDTRVGLRRIKFQAEEQNGDNNRANAKHDSSSSSGSDIGDCRNNHDSCRDVDRGTLSSLQPATEPPPNAIATDCCRPPTSQPSSKQATKTTSFTGAEADELPPNLTTMTINKLQTKNSSNSSSPLACQTSIVNGASNDNNTTTNLRPNISKLSKRPSAAKSGSGACNANNNNNNIATNSFDRTKSNDQAAVTANCITSCAGAGGAGVHNITSGGLQAQQTTPSGKSTPSGSNTSSGPLATHKAAITLGIIMGSFLCCWVPFFCINIIKAFCSDCITSSMFRFFTWLGYANSALNPIIYGIHNSEFRCAFNRIVFKHFSLKNTNLSRRFSFDIRNQQRSQQRNRNNHNNKQNNTNNSNNNSSSKGKTHNISATAAKLVYKSCSNASLPSPNTDTNTTREVFS